jgi:hypothetical protein
MTAQKPNTLTDSDFIQAAKTLRCDVSAIRAVTEIESPKGGFLYDEHAGCLLYTSDAADDTR